MPTLADLIASLDTIPERNPSGEVGVIYARRPWSPDSEAVVLYGERSVESVTMPGFTYLLEVGLCKEVIEVWSSWRDGRTPTLTEAVGAVIWYGEHDAYEPVDELDKIRTHLLTDLSDLIRLLDTHREEHWASWLAERRDRIAHGDEHALRQLRSSFGGMGSLNDLVIHPINGHRIGDTDVERVNQQVRDLLTKVWTGLQAVLRELDRP
jgi:hypothetical protein